MIEVLCVIAEKDRISMLWTITAEYRLTVLRLNFDLRCRPI